MENNNMKYTELPYDKSVFDEYKVKTFPQIFVKDKHIGGWSDFYKYVASRFNYDKLYDIAYLATVNLNQVIDINYYPVPQTKLSNMKHRPIGLGIQGLADALVLLRIPFESEEALNFNSKIMETIYLASITASADIAKSRYEPMKQLDKSIKYPEFYDKNFMLENKLYHELKPNIYEINNNTNSYSTFNGSPFSRGEFQFDLCGIKPELNWDNVREQVKTYGIRNSLLTALMPTASTSQILGNNECFEFFTNNIYTRKTQAGDFLLINKYLVNDLISVGLWSLELKDKIIAANGSIQHLDVPPEFKLLYKTIWEIKQVWVLKAAKARGSFVDQTQSMNIFIDKPDYQKLGSCHMWSWKNGLKTGMYYLRTKPSTDAIKFTIDPNINSCENCSA
jgi:ribonucleoside-diphosphate reductase alpha chain